LKKNDVLEVLIEDIKFPNIATVKVEDRVLEVKGALPGQRLLVRVVKKGKVNKGQVIEVLEPAPQEVLPDCQLFGLCGGCAFQNIPYEYEIKLKTDMVKQILNDSNTDHNIEEKFLPTIAAPATSRYRNKMEYSFGDDGKCDDNNRKSNLTLGMRKKGSYYEAVDATNCLLPHEDFGKIAAATLAYFKNHPAPSGHPSKEGNFSAAFYHRKRGTGTLRHLVIRHGVGTNEILVNLVTIGGDNYDDYAKMILNVPIENKIVSIINTVNNSVADAIIPEEVKILYGQDFIHERLVGGMYYKIPAFSFFQTNPVLTEVLYATIADFAGDLTHKTVFDLYCGAGTIGLYLAKSNPTAKILGIEIVDEAIKSAEENAALNDIGKGRAEFITGDVKKVVREITCKPDIIILDPPREGISPKAIPDILAFNAQKIIYVSCKPTSLTKNLPAFLEGGYKITKIICIDMFPRTANIETIVLLTKL
jgi:23S rRNA (uracil-5-)-methyltransferase RumA